MFDRPDYLDGHPKIGPCPMFLGMPPYLHLQKTLRIYKKGIPILFWFGFRSSKMNSLPSRGKLILKLEIQEYKINFQAKFYPISSHMSIDVKDLSIHTIKTILGIFDHIQNEKDKRIVVLEIVKLINEHSTYFLTKTFFDWGINYKEHLETELDKKLFRYFNELITRIEQEHNFDVLAFINNEEIDIFDLIIHEVPKNYVEFLKTNFDLDMSIIRKHIIEIINNIDTDIIMGHPIDLKKFLQETFNQIYYNRYGSFPTLD